MCGVIIKRDPAISPRYGQ
jgi:hypothetical protein